MYKKIMCIALVAILIFLIKYKVCAGKFIAYMSEELFLPENSGVNLCLLTVEKNTTKKTIANTACNLITDETQIVTENETIHETLSEIETKKATNAETETEADTETETVLQDTLTAATSIYSREQLLDYNFVLNNFYVVPSATTLRKSVLDLEKINSTDITIQKNSEVPQILIFHTHSQEYFSDTPENGMTIVNVGDYLTELLQTQYGYNVMHIKDTFDIVNGVLDRSEAYNCANVRLDELLKEYPSIQVVIDLHRDGVDESKHLITTIDGKQTAKIMLFNGISYSNEQGDIESLYNPYITENLTMTYKMYLRGKISYPDFIRCIYISGYRYCFYHVPRSMLVEAGAQTNTYEEVCNAMEPFAKLLDEILTTS